MPPPPLERKLQRIYDEATSNGSQPETNYWPDFKTSKERLEQEVQSHWLWTNAIPEGSIAMLAGQPRTGKSTLALNLTLAMSRGNEFLNRDTEKCQTAYISLDNSQFDMKRIIEQVGLCETDSVFFHEGQVPEQSVLWLFDRIKKHGVKFCVVDTFLRFMHIEKINDPMEVTRAMDPINHQAEQLGCSLMWVHHAGKGAGENMTGAVGSISIKGMSPYYFELTREYGARIFSSDLRSGENFHGAYLKLNNMTGWIETAGGRYEALMERTETMILDFLAKEEEPATEKTIFEMVDARKLYIGRALRNLHKAGQIERTGKGGRSDPFRYAPAGDLLGSQAREHDGSMMEPKPLQSGNENHLNNQEVIHAPERREYQQGLFPVNSKKNH